MADVFISYARKNQEMAQSVRDSLICGGFTVWWDEYISVGDQLDTQIEREIDQAVAVVVLWSQQSASSEWVRNEAALASSQGKLVPVLIENVRIPLPHRLAKTINLCSFPRNIRDPRMIEIWTAVERLKLSTIEAFRVIQADRIAGKARVATTLSTLIDMDSNYSDIATLEFGYHEFARLGARKAVSKIQELSAGTKNQFVCYSLKLLEALGRLASGDSNFSDCLRTDLNKERSLTEEENVSVAMIEILVFGALNDSVRIKAAWRILAEASNFQEDDTIKHFRLSFDRAVRSVIYGNEPLDLIVQSLPLVNTAGLVHYSAALCKAVRMSDDILIALMRRSEEQKWLQVRDIVDIRRRCRLFEVLVLPTAGTLFGKRVKTFSPP